MSGLLPRQIFPQAPRLVSVLRFFLTQRRQTPSPRLPSTIQCLQISGSAHNLPSFRSDALSGLIILPFKCAPCTFKLCAFHNSLAGQPRISWYFIRRDGAANAVGRCLRAKGPLTWYYTHCSARYNPWRRITLDVIFLWDPAPPPPDTTELKFCLSI